MKRLMIATVAASMTIGGFATIAAEARPHDGPRYYRHGGYGGGWNRGWNRGYHRGWDRPRYYGHRNRYYRQRYYNRHGYRVWYR